MRKEEKSLLKRIIENTDWILVGSLFFLIGAGILGVYSAVLHYGNPGKFITTQVAAVGIGLAGMIIFMSFNYQNFRQMIYPIYVISMVLMISVLFLGTTIRGTRGWFHLGLFSFQPVELAKLMFILVLAGYLDIRYKEVKTLSVFAAAIALLMGHIILIMLQPDFSSTLSYFPVTVILLFAAGVYPSYLAGIILFGMIATGLPLAATFLKLQPVLIAAHPKLIFIVNALMGNLSSLLILLGVIILIFISWWFLYKFKISIPLIYPVILSLIIILGSFSSIVVQKSLKEYQRKRLIVFINPEIDPLGSGYNIIQSKIAIGSGRLFGRGLFSGKQTQLGFLPEQHTDFIFSVIGEETGYVFSQAVIIFYFILIWRSLVIAREARDRYGSLVALGIAGMFTFYSVINIGMTMGLMPATGMPVPLLSYGGSSMVSSLWAIGLLFSVHIRRFTN